MTALVTASTRLAELAVDPIARRKKEGTDCSAPSSAEGHRLRS